MKKRLACALFFAAILLWLTWYGAHLLKLARMAPHYYAKETCSCMFVMERSQKFCQGAWENEDVKNYSIKVDTDKKIVRTQFLIFTSKAQWIDPYRGCRLN